MPAGAWLRTVSRSITCLMIGVLVLGIHATTLGGKEGTRGSSETEQQQNAVALLEEACQDFTAHGAPRAFIAACDALHPVRNGSDIGPPENVSVSRRDDLLWVLSGSACRRICNMLVLNENKTDVKLLCQSAGDANFSFFKTEEEACDSAFDELAKGYVSDIQVEFQFLLSKNTTVSQLAEQLRLLPQPGRIRRLELLNYVTAGDVARVVSALPSLEALTVAKHQTELANEGLTALTADLLGSLPPSLTFLNFSQSRLTRVEFAGFGHLGNLTHVILDTNRLEALSENAFDYLPNIVVLSLRDNAITALPDIDPKLQLSSLITLDVSHNKLKSIPSSLLHAAGQMTTLQLGNNEIGAIEADAFRLLTDLQRLGLSRNNLLTVDGGLFDGLAKLEYLDLGFNALSQLPGNAFADLVNLRSLTLAANEMTHLQDSLLAASPLLELLDLDYNHLTALPVNLKSLTKLKLLSLDGNAVSGMDDDTFAGMSALETLSFDSNEVTALPETLFRSLTALSSIWFGGNRIKELPPGLFEGLSALFLLSFPLNFLTSLPPDLFEPLVDLGHLNLSHHSSLRLDNVAQTFDWGSLQLLDISNTSIRPLPSMCEAPSSVFILRSMAASEPTPVEDVIVNLFRSTERPDHDATGYVADLFSHCLRTAALIDISANQGLNNQTWMQEVLGQIFVDVPLRFDEAERLTIPKLQLKGAPVECGITGSSQTRTFGSGFAAFVSDLPVFGFLCSCTQGYEATRDGDVCLPIQPFWQPWRVALLVLGCVSVVLGTVLLLNKFQRKQKRLKYNLLLHEDLLAESRIEVTALKQAWEVDPQELSLEGRLDTGSEGAFGEVWRGTWGNTPVAVKVLRKFFIDSSDHATVAEFEKEAQFMMTVRHPHVVRFFGAGSFDDHTPFLVMEILPRGSLKRVLDREPDLSWEVRYQSFRCTHRCPWLLSRPPRTSLLTAPMPTRRQVRMGYILDVCKGMKYIHGLGHVHRDLKSANVLVTDGERAKVRRRLPSRLLPPSGSRSSLLARQLRVRDATTRTLTPVPRSVILAPSAL